MMWWWYYEICGIGFTNQTTNNSFQPCCAFFVSETIIISLGCCSANVTLIHLCPQLSIAQLVSLNINKQTMQSTKMLSSCHVKLLDIPGFFELKISVKQGNIKTVVLNYAMEMFPLKHLLWLMIKWLCPILFSYF